MDLYLLNGEETLDPYIAPRRSHIALAVSEAEARELVEKEWPHFKVAKVELIKHFPGDEPKSHIVGQIALTRLH